MMAGTVDWGHGVGYTPPSPPSEKPEDVLREYLLPRGNQDCRHSDAPCPECNALEALGTLVRDLAAAKFGEREWRDRAHDMERERDGWRKRAEENAAALEGVGRERDAWEETAVLRRQQRDEAVLRASEGYGHQMRLENRAIRARLTTYEDALRAIAHADLWQGMSRSPADAARDIARAALAETSVEVESAGELVGGGAATSAPAVAPLSASTPSRCPTCGSDYPQPHLHETLRRGHTKTTEGEPDA